MLRIITDLSKQYGLGLRGVLSSYLQVASRSPRVSIRRPDPDIARELGTRIHPAGFLHKCLDRILGGLQWATYRSARAHLLIVLLSALSSHVQRMTAVNGFAFLSKGRLANLKACRRSLLVLRRTL